MSVDIARARLRSRRPRRLVLALAAGALALVLALVLALAFRLIPDRTPTAEELAALPALQPTDIDSGLAYSLDAVAKDGAVPPTFVKELGSDLLRIRDTATRKRTFLKVMLPIVARENERILAERRRILDDPGGVDAELFQKYRADVGDLETLRRRVDVVPASLVLAQAALESGWGSSRFSRQGNNFFGIRTYDEDVAGMHPAEATGFWVVRYPSISDSVRAYMLNLNSHPAYAALRRARAAMRAAGETPAGAPLTDHLSRYSEKPSTYGRLLRDIIDANRLARFDGLRLAS